MHICLLIATIGRTQELARLLESLCSQRYQNFSVLICNQNPPNFLEQTLAPFQDRLHITCIHMPASGVSAARNALFPHITGDIVAFPDDDCWYAPDTLESVVAFFQAHTSVGGIMGIWGDNAENLQHENRCFSEAKVITLHNVFSRGETYVQFYRQHVIEGVGPFDNTLGPGTGLPYGGGEDTDYALRAFAITDMWRVPNVHLFHPKQDMQKPNKEKLYKYAAGRMYLLRKHRFSLWFRLLNVAFPLVKLFMEKPATWLYRWYMFVGRLKALFSR